MKANDFERLYRLIKKHKNSLTDKEKLSIIHHIATCDSNDYEKALRTLVQLNAWRRDDKIPNSYAMPNAKEIGIAIDIAINELTKIVGKEFKPQRIDEENQ